MASAGERAFKTLMLVLGEDLPAPEYEYRFAPPRKWRFDAAWVSERLALEINGGKWQTGGGRHNTAGDYEKLQTAAALGWRVFPVLPEQLTNDPHTLFDLLREALKVTE